jgi:hypothetical protein
MSAPRKSPAASKSPEAYLEEFPSTLAEVGARVRAIVLDSLPGVVERVYPGWNLIGYRIPVGAETRYCCYLNLTKSDVELGFEHGRLLSDPDGVLTGSGTQVRKIVFHKVSDIRPRVVRRLLAEASTHILETTR